MGSQFQDACYRARIIFNNRRSAIDCTVRQMSDFEATLEVANSRTVPSRFDLLVLGEAAARACVIRDVHANKLSVVFTDPPPWQQQTSTQASFGRKRPPEPAAPMRADSAAAKPALDEAEFGVIVVDADLRATFVNRAFRALWNVPEALADSCPPLRELLRQSRPLSGRTAPAAGFDDAHLEQICMWAKEGNAAPADFRLDSGEVRFHCIALPDKRRMLTFTRVTDFAARVDDLEMLRAALDNVDQGIVIMDSNLIVHFVNKRARSMWRLSAEQCDHKPIFAQFLYDIAATGIYDVSDAELEEYVIGRFTVVQSGDESPMDVRIKGDRIVRAQLTVLPNGGRMLTYTDVTDLVRRAEFHEQMSKVDTLTKLPNRRNFLDTATTEWERFCRYHQKFSVLTLDLDNLKDINERHGHDAGDRAIMHVAEVCTSEKRSPDLVARIGADEFAVLMPGTDADGAYCFADRLQAAITASPLLPEDLQLSVSVGVAEAHPDMSSIAALLKLADERLAAGKRCRRHALANGDQAGGQADKPRGNPAGGRSS